MINYFSFSHATKNWILPLAFPLFMHVHRKALENRSAIRQVWSIPSVQLVLLEADYSKYDHSTVSKFCHWGEKLRWIRGKQRLAALLYPAQRLLVGLYIKPVNTSWLYIMIITGPEVWIFFSVCLREFPICLISLPYLRLYGVPTGSTRYSQMCSAGMIDRFSRMWSKLSQPRTNVLVLF